MAFKILIIGGSITGLSLAAILERYGIDYELFERYGDVAPAVGASIGLLGHGSRILEQLGCYEELIPFGTGVQDMHYHGPDGKHLGAHVNLGPHLETMVGYRIFFVERQRVLRALWGAIKDKSKIHLSCRVAKIEHFDGGVQLETQDGRVHSGSMLVGADGVRSKTRDEMWRLAESDNCDTTADRKAIRSSRSCIFGISRGLAQVSPVQSWKHVRQGRHYLCSGAPNGLTFWFVFFKTRKQAESWDTLRYTEEEKEEYAAEFSDDQVRPDLTFGEMYRAATTTVLVPLEEFVLQKYHHKRILLLGDSVHKMHPLTGHGGNAAIEDSALLANRLKDLLETAQKPTGSQLKEIFHELQEERRPRTEQLTLGARGLAQLESFGSPLLKLVMLYMFPKIPCEDILASVGEPITQGKPLKYLPLPARSKGLVPYEDEVGINTRIRSIKVSYLWICLFILMGSLRVILPATVTGSSVSSSSPQGYATSSYFSINAFWLIESYRSAFSLGPLLSPIPWILLAQFLGWEIALPIYFSFWILGSRTRGFFYPWPRAIPPAAAQAFPFAFITAVAAPTPLPFLLGSHPLLSKLNPWTLAHLVTPLLTSLIEDVIVRFRGRRREPVYQFGTFDLKYLSRFFAAAFVVSGTSHIYFVSQHIKPSLEITPSLASIQSQESINFIILNILIATWLLFTLWDLRRINVTTVSYTKGPVYILLALILTGPGAALIASWWLREIAWEESRHRISEERYETRKVGGA
ncbi:hypothetical protein BDV12DRAFT_175419 [Aspergillus spectabilis]